MRAHTYWSMQTQRVYSESQGPLFAWRLSEWVIAPSDLFFSFGGTLTGGLCLTRHWKGCVLTLSVPCRLNWIRVKSVCRLHSPWTWQHCWSSSSGSCQSLCYPQSYMQPSSKPRSCPPRRRGPRPPCCCPVCCPNETWTPCGTSSASSRVSLRGILLSC